MDLELNYPVVKSSDPMFDVASLHLEEEDYLYDTRRRAAGFLTPTTATAVSLVSPYKRKQQDFSTKMLAAEFMSNILDMIETRTENSDVHKSAVFDMGIKTNGATLVMNTSNSTESSSQELFYRHSMVMTAVYCVAYLLVFSVGIIGNFFVIAVVLRSPRMRTVTNFFIVNLAVADILVIIFCLPATLLSNIFVRKYNTLMLFF